MKIYMSDIRKAKMCARGSRAFFLSQGWDWQDFLENGIDLEIVKSTNDAMVQQVINMLRCDFLLKLMVCAVEAVAHADSEIEALVFIDCVMVLKKWIRGE